MPLIVKEDVFLDPVDLGSLGAQTVVLAANRFSYPDRAVSVSEWL
jgi:hypothetical protein